MNRLWAFLIGIDQLLNIIFGSGWPNETLSSYFYRLMRDYNKPFWCNLTDRLFFWQEAHCFESYLKVKHNMYAPFESRSKLRWYKKVEEGKKVSK